MIHFDAFRLLAAWIMLIAFVTPVFAQEAGTQKSAGWSVGELMNGMAQVKKSSATFKEKKYISMLTEPLLFAGTLEYTAPGRLEKHTRSPRRESMVLDGDRLEVQADEAGSRRILSLQEFPAIWALVESIRSTLAGDVETLNRFYEVTVEGHRKRWMLKLSPRDSKMSSMVREIRIKGSRDQIGTIEIREAGGDRSVMEITRVDS